MAELYVSPTGAGDFSGSDAANASTIDHLSDLIALAGPDGRVFLLADQGAYKLSGAIIVQDGGTLGAPVTIAGVDGNGQPMQAEFVGTRSDIYDESGVRGNDAFRLLDGANNLNFESMAFEDFGIGAFRVGAPIEHLSISKMYAENVSRFFENLVSSGNTDASIDGLTIKEVQIAGFSKDAIRIQYNTSNVLIEDVIGDSEKQDGDNFAMGLHLTDTVHDVAVHRVEFHNATDTLDPAYFNGDGFVTERGVYNVLFDTVAALGNTDGGFDLKSQNTVVQNAIAIDNARDFRLWDFSVTLNNVLSGATNTHTGDSLPASVWLSRGSSSSILNSYFFEPHPSTPVFDLRYGNLVLTLQNVYTSATFVAATIGGSELNDLGYDGSVTFIAGVSGNDIIYGNAGKDIIDADGGNDQIFGGQGDDQLVGGAGNDYLDGGDGGDLMVGGEGDDVYVIDSVNDLTGETENAGNDTILTTLSSYILRVNTEDLVYTGGGDFSGTGNLLDNSITGGTGDDTLRGMRGSDVLDGGAGNDRLFGGEGDDVYFVDSEGDIVTERAAEGQDTVYSINSAYTLSTDVERLIYSGTESFSGTGNAQDNYISGGEGDDLLIGLGGDDKLIGGRGSDRMVGGLGDDVYDVDRVGDVVVELAGEGRDTVKTSLGFYTLTANLEVLTYTGSATFQGRGNALDNILTGGAVADSLEGFDGNDVLDGGLGADRLIGGLGDDIYYATTGDTILEYADEGHDTVRAETSVYTLGDNLENLTSVGNGNFNGVGNALQNTIVGGSEADYLDGGAGADRLLGGKGNDAYVVDDASDQVLEATGEGIDRVETILATYTLGENVENLLFTGDGSFVGTGNRLDNILIGGAGTDILHGGLGEDLLDGGLGADLLVGGAGDDVLVVNDAGDRIVEDSDAGVDTVRTSLVTY